MRADKDGIRTRLTELGWSQSRLASEAGLSLVMVNSFLNGKRGLSEAASLRVASALADGLEEKKLIVLADRILALAKESPTVMAKLEELLR